MIIRDARIGQVKDRFLLGKIHTLDDFYKIIPRTKLAKEAKITAGRLKEPRKLLVSEVRLLAELLELPVLAMADIIVKDFPAEPVKKVNSIDLKKSILNDRLYLGHLQTLHEVFEIVPRTLVAHSLGSNNNVLGRFMITPENANMRLVVRVAAALGISTQVLFNLIENELRDKEGRALLKLKAYKKSIPSVK